MTTQEDSNPYRFLNEMDPTMNADEVVAKIHRLNRLEYNKTQDPVDEARRQQLQDNGYNPTDWTWYSNTRRLDGQSNVSILEDLAGRFPKDVEFLVIQGLYTGGVTGIHEGAVAVMGVSQYSFDPEGYTTYVRVRPKQLGE